MPPLEARQEPARPLPLAASGRQTPPEATPAVATGPPEPPGAPEPRTAAEWARRVLEEGFAALDAPAFVASASQVAAARAQVLRRYESFLALARARGVDLARTEDAERLAGFYVREGGRVDMQLVAAAAPTTALAPGLPVAPVDAAALLELARPWQPVLSALFAAHEGLAGADVEGGAEGGRFALEYVGCVLSRPGDGDQNWHLDGVHRDPSRHEPADRVNVFVPLVAIDKRAGGTEMKKGSHVRVAGAGGARFEAYARLESVTHRVAAGTPVVMDYRVWHRGLANTSADTVRPLLYFKYALQPHPASSKRASHKGQGGRKRITPVPA